VKADIPNTAKDSDLLIGGLSNRRPAGAQDRAGVFAGTRPAQIPAADARTAVTALYQVHAVGLIRLAVIMTGDRQAAEDVVQEAFCGLFRRWAHLATATGTALATVSPPRPYRTFSWVSGAADDRTFVLASQPWVPGASPTRNSNEPTKFFLLHFDPATGAAPLTALPITEREGYRVIGLALSPDGSKLAVLLATPHDPQQSRKIQIFTLATGSQHDWTWAGQGWVGTQDSLGQPLSWAADGRTLAFQQWTGEHLDVRLLDTAAAGSSLRSARPAVAVLSSNNDDSNSLLTPDGRTVIYAPAQGTQENTLHPRFRERLNFAEFSASTGKLVRTLDPWWFSLGSGQLPYQQVLWTNSSGGTLIVISPPGASPAGHWVRHSIQPVLGVLTGNHFTPIPGSPTASQNITCVAW
jgi:Sigma-70 region 2